MILYTSGTTGRPKGAVLTHGNLTFNTMNQLAHADVLRTDTALAIAPLFHASGLGQVSLPTLFKGGRVAVLPRFDPAAVLEAIQALRIASFGAAPTMLQMLCEHPAFAGTDLGSLRYVIYGGSMVAERVAVAWQRRGVVLLQGYGMTEASPGVHLASPDGAPERPTSIGSPHFFTDVAFSPLGDGDDDGRSGELLVRGLNVFRGYWNRPQDTARALADGWFHSGDVVRVDQDGWAYVVDRIKDMIISGGENIYPAEVEAQHQLTARHHGKRRHRRRGRPLGRSRPGLHRRGRRIAPAVGCGDPARGTDRPPGGLQDPQARPRSRVAAEDRHRQGPQAGPKAVRRAVTPSAARLARLLDLQVGGGHRWSVARW